MPFDRDIRPRALEVDVRHVSSEFFARKSLEAISIGEVHHVRELPFCGGSTEALCHR